MPNVSKKNVVQNFENYLEKQIARDFVDSDLIMTDDEWDNFVDFEINRRKKVFPWDEYVDLKCFFKEHAVPIKFDLAICRIISKCLPVFKKECKYYINKKYSKNMIRILLPPKDPLS